MKQAASAFFSILFVFIFQFTASAAVLEDMPIVSNEALVHTLQKNTNLKANLTIGADDILIIPEGKRMTLKSDKTLTIRGVLYIEEGGRLIVESGNVRIGASGAIISYGDISVKEEGNINIAKNGSFIVSESGSLKQKGNITAKDSYGVACFGEYTGDGDYAAEILYALSVTTSLKGYEYHEIHTEAEAKALFPKKITVDEEQINPAGGYITKVYLLCTNNHIVEINYNGTSYEIGSIAGMRFIAEE